MSKKSVEIYTDSTAGRGFARKDADKSKTAKVSVKSPVEKICELFVKNKSADAVKRIAKLSAADKETLKRFAILIYAETDLEFPEKSGIDIQSSHQINWT